LQEKRCSQSLQGKEVLSLENQGLFLILDLRLSMHASKLHHALLDTLIPPTLPIASISLRRRSAVESSGCSTSSHLTMFPAATGCFSFTLLANPIGSAPSDNDFFAGAKEPVTQYPPSPSRTSPDSRFFFATEITSPAKANGAPVASRLSTAEATLIPSSIPII